MATSEEQDIDAIFRFDPFEDSGSEEGEEDSGKKLDEEYSADGADGAGDAGSEQADDGSQGKSEEEAGASEDSGDQQKPDKSGEPAEGEDPRDKQIADLQEQLQQTAAQLQTMQNQMQQKPDDSGKGEEEQSDEVPDYMFQIPEQIANGIASEDVGERQQALNLLVSGIGRSVHSQLQTQFRKELEERVAKVQQESQATTQHQTQADTIRQDYFGQYPKHDTDLIRPVVQAKSREVMQEWNVAKWTPRVRDEIGRRVDEELRKSGFAGEPAPETPKGNGQASPPHMRRSGARPAGSGGGPNSEHDIESTLFG